MCLKDETKFPENNDVVYGWKIFQEKDGVLTSFWRYTANFYPLRVRQVAEVYSYMQGCKVPVTFENTVEAGFYFFPNREEAMIALRQHRRYAGKGTKFVLTLCRFEGILAKGEDNTFGGDTDSREAMRAKYMEIIEVVRSHKKKEIK